MQKDFGRVDYKCHSCRSMKHNLSNCPYVHFTANEQKIIAMSKRSEDQIRNEMEITRTIKKFNRYDRLVDVVETAGNF